jgi:conjugal transfer pilus assembly protein TraF
MISRIGYAAGFFNDAFEGWFWYEEPLPKLEEKEQKTQNPSYIIKNYSRQLEEQLHLALVDPKVENIAQYLKLQQRLFSNSMLFARGWKKTLLNYPELDETVKYPINNVGRGIYLTQHRENIDNKIKQIAQKYGLLFFFNSHCKYCHEFAKTVKRFAEIYNWKVLAISADGGSLAEFKNAKVDNGILNNLNIFAVPALIAFDPTTNNTIPITFGFISAEELVERISLLFNLGDL